MMVFGSMLLFGANVTRVMQQAMAAGTDVRLAVDGRALPLAFLPSVSIPFSGSTLTQFSAASGSLSSGGVSPKLGGMSERCSSGGASLSFGNASLRPGAFAHRPEAAPFQPKTAPIQLGLAPLQSGGFSPQSNLASVQPAFANLLARAEAAERLSFARGVIALPLETPAQRTDAGAFVRAYEAAHGLRLCSLEEISRARGISGSV